MVDLLPERASRCRRICFPTSFARSLWAGWSFVDLRERFRPIDFDASMNFTVLTRKSLFVVLALVASARADVPELLDDAVHNFLKDSDRWAYTQAVVQKDAKGKIQKQAVVRFDPSKPYPEQYSPISVDGAPPSAADLEEYRLKGEKLGRRAEKLEKQGTDRFRKSVGELMDLANAKIAEETAGNVTFEVPLKKEDNKRFPPEKFRVLARVGKATRAFERIEVKLREPMRTAVVVKIKAGEGSLDFAKVNPEFAPTPVAARGSGSASVFFVPMGRDYEVKREDFKRVKPYSDRFGVQIGTLKALDF